MSDPICCLLGICCPPFSAEQEQAFRQVLGEMLRDERKAEKIAKHLAHDLGKLSASIAALARD